MSENEQAKPKRGFQFTLKRLLIWTAIAGALLAVISHQFAVYYRSASAARSIAELGGAVSWNPELAENLIKYQTISRITDVHFTDPNLDEGQWKSLSRIPKRFGLQIDGPTFTPESMTHLVEVQHLDYLVLSNTTVGDADVIEFQRQRPDVTVMFGYPGDSQFKEFPASR